jgi:hypothetical protein
MSCNFLLVSETSDHLRVINSSLFLDHVTADMLGCLPQLLGHQALWVNYTRPSQALCLWSQLLPKFPPAVGTVTTCTFRATEAGLKLELRGQKNDKWMPQASPFLPFPPTHTRVPRSL